MKVSGQGPKKLNKPYEMQRLGAVQSLRAFGRPQVGCTSTAWQGCLHAPDL